MKTKTMALEVAGKVNNIEQLNNLLLSYSQNN